MNRRDMIGMFGITASIGSLLSMDRTARAAGDTYVVPAGVEKVRVSLTDASGKVIKAMDVPVQGGYRFAVEVVA